MRYKIIPVILICLMVLIGCTEVKNSEPKNDNEPTSKEIEIFTFYNDNLMEEMDNFYNAQDEGLKYKYANEDELESEVAKDTALKYQITVNELNQIYAKIIGYRLKNGLPLE